MASTDPNWYCPRCDTKSPYRTKYCSKCEGHSMLFFHCPVTKTDDRYTHFTTRHLPQCRTCTRYHRQLDDSTRKNRELHTEALSDTTQGMCTLCHFSTIYCDTTKCMSTYLTYVIQYMYCAM